MPSGQVVEPPPAPEGGRLIEPSSPAPIVLAAATDAPAVDATALTDAELEAQIAADLAAADAEIAAADAGAVDTPPEPPATPPPTPSLYVRLYAKDARDTNGALLAPTAPVYHELGGPYPRMLTIGGRTYERAGVDADGFETYRQPDF